MRSESLISSATQGFDPRQAGSATTVLLVEDNLDDERLVIRAFNKVGIEDVIVARTGEDALSELESTRKPGSLALVFLDLKLPRLHGLEVLRALRADESTSRVPVVVFTSSDEEGDIAKSYDMGANSYIRKPVDYDSFMEAVNATVHYWLKLNCPPSNH